MNGILSLLGSLSGQGGNPLGTLGAAQRMVPQVPTVQTTADDSTNGSWNQTRGHKRTNDED